MCDEKLKSNYAKEKHGEFMLAIARAIFMALFPAMLGSYALKMIGSASQVDFWAYFGLSAVAGFIALYLMIAGLKRIDLAHENKAVSMIGSEQVREGASPLNMTVSHGATQITIRIEQVESK